MSEDDSVSDLWGGLAQEAESLEESRKVTVPKQPLTRRVSLREKLAGAFLSGFLPALLALWVGVLLASARCATISPKNTDLTWGLLVVGLVLALPLAALTSSLWSVGRQTASRYLALAVLAAGVGQVTMTLPYYWAATLLPRQMSVARIMQRLYESFLSFNATPVYAVAALALFAACTRLRRSVPWVELGRPASVARLGVATLIILSPLLLLAGFALAHGRVAPRAEWAYEAIFKEPRQPRETETRLDWHRIQEALEVSDHGYFDSYERRPSKWSTEAHQQAEKQAVTLLSDTGKLGGWEQNEVTAALMSRPQDLATPLDFACAVIKFELANSPDSSSVAASNAMAMVVLPSLGQRPFSKLELESQLARLEALEATLKDPAQELEEQLLQSLRWHLCPSPDDLPTPLTAFGMEVPFGPERLLAEYRLRQVLYSWMEVRKNLNWTSQEQLERSLALELAQHPTGITRYDEDLLQAAARSATNHCFSLKLRPLFASARTMIALRLFRLENGAYPDTLSQLGTELPVDPGVTSYKVEDGHAVLGREHEASWRSKEVPTWTLP